MNDYKAEDKRVWRIRRNLEKGRGRREEGREEKSENRTNGRL
jgi:hypothetical protein